MNTDFDMRRPMIGQRWLTTIGRVLALPVDIVLCVLVWLSVDVLGPMAALPEAFHHGMRMQIARVRTRNIYRQEEAAIRAEIRLQIRARQIVFEDLVNGLKALERTHAGADYQFAESLAAAIAAYEAQVAALEGLPNDPVFRQRFEALVSRPLDR
ncbi:MAG TPA: hypothetical protein VNZ55_13435 [Thermomicrobiales bacterium]|nr:hypothetical protein [Thermomicrobiales bacterium]